MSMKHDAPARPDPLPEPRPEEGYERLYTDSPIGIYRRDAGGAILDANPALARLFGYDSVRDFLDEAGADPTMFYVNPDKRSEALAVLARDGSLSGFEFRAFCRDGSVIWISESARLSPNAGSNAPHFGFMEDVTARKSAEWALAEAEERYHDIFDNAVEGVFRLMPGERFVLVNAALARMLGYDSPEDLLAGPDVAKTVFEDEESGRALFREAAESGEVRFFETRLRRRTGDALWASINARAVKDAAGEVLLLEGSMIDVTEKRRADDLLRKSLLETRGLFLESVMALAKTVRFRDSYTAGHQENVAEISCRIARRMGLSKDAVEGLRLAGLLHDIGKINVPLRYLTKPGRLDKYEWSFMQEHPRTGYDILKNIRFPWPIADMVLQHHERMDGTGYPNGLGGGEILLEARIMAVADVIDAMASHRPYRPALGIAKALEEVRRNAGRLYDPDAAAAALEIFGDDKDEK